MKKVIETSFKSQDHTLYGIYEEPENPRSSLILLLHGLTNSHTDCPLIADATIELHKNRFSTFRFDYFGSGKSEGEFKDKTFAILHKNTIDALKFITEKVGYKRVGLWGRSLGAILGATLCDDTSIFASVFISFCIHTDESFARFFPKDKKFSLPIRGTGKIKGKPILPFKFYEETKWIDALQKEHLAKAKNILIMQGTQDKTVYDLDWAKEIYDLVREPKKLQYIEGADHAYKDYEKKVIKQGIKWFLEEDERNESDLSFWKNVATYKSFGLC